MTMHLLQPHRCRETVKMRGDKKSKTEPNNNKVREPWINATEAAAYLGLRSRKAVYQAVRRGQIPVHRLGKRMLFRKEEIDAVILG